MLTGGEERSSLLPQRKAHAKALWSDAWMGSMAGADEQETAWSAPRSLALLESIVRKLLSRKMIMWPPREGMEEQKVGVGGSSPQ